MLMRSKTFENDMRRLFEEAFLMEKINDVSQSIRFEYWKVEHISNTKSKYEKCFDVARSEIR